MEDGKYAQISRPLIEQAQEDTGSYEGSMTEIDFAGVLSERGLHFKTKWP